MIAHVFEAFQQLNYVVKEVKDNERSVLGITHFTAKEHADEKVGGFIPFDAFFNRQFSTNLTNRGDKAIQNALELTYVKTNPFAERVVKVLFMISNLLESQKQTFPSNVENLAVLLMDTLDANKMQLQKEVQSVLDKLIEESIIREENGSYFFFNEDEMDVQNVIKNQTVNLDDRLTTFDDLLRPILKINQKVPFGQNDFRVGYAIEGKEFFRNGDFAITVLITDSTDLHQKALDVAKNELVICLNEWYNNDPTFRNDFHWYCQTNKYFLTQAGASTGERNKTNENFRIRNNQLRSKLEGILKHKILETRFISQNHIVEPDQVNGATPADRISNIIQKHLDGIYKNHKLSNDYARNQAELKQAAADNQAVVELLTPAEQLVNDFISANNNRISVQDLIHNFAKEPFGWRFEAVLHVLIQLVKKKKREFVYKGQPRYPIVDFINKAVSTAERSSCEVVSGEEIDQSVLDAVVQAYKVIFNDNLAGTTDKNTLYDDLIAAFKKKLDEHQLWENDYYGKYPFGNCFHKATHQLNQWIQTRDIKKLFETLIEEQEESKKLFDTAKAIQDFMSRALNDYREMMEFVRAQNDNVKMLSEEHIEKVRKINQFLGEEDPRNDFRHIKKAYDEVQQALKDKLKEFRQETIDVYERIFDELEQEANKKNVDAAAYANREYILNKIKKLDSLSALKNEFLNANNFKSLQLEKIIEAIPVEAGSVAKEPQSYYVSRKASTIENEEELDQYLKELRKDMLALLQQNKTIIIK